MKLSILATLVLLFCGSADAQYSLPRDVRYYLQDRQGFIWVATVSGVYRLDAHDAHRFGVEHGLISDLTSWIAETSDGTIWFGHPNGLSNYVAGRFHSVLKGRAAVPTAVTRGRVVLGGATTLSVGTKDTTGGWSIQDYPSIPVASNVVEDGDGRFWFISIGQLSSIDGRTMAGPVTKHTSFQTGLIGFNFLELDDRGRVFFRVNFKSFLYEQKTRRLLELPVQEAAHDTSEGTYSRDAHGRIWMTNGLDIGFLLDGTFHSRVVKAKQSPNVPFMDREGTLWVDNEPIPAFEEWARGIPAGLTQAGWSLRRDERGALWIGTARSLEVLDGREWRSVPIPIVGGNKRGPFITLETAPGGGFYTGDRTGGLLWVERKGTIGASLRSPEAGNWFPRVIRKGRQGKLWVASNLGLHAATLDGHSFRLSQVELPGVGTAVRAFAITPKGYLVAGSQNGLAILDDTGKLLTHLSTADGLLENSIQCLAANDDVIWFGYDTARAFGRIEWRDRQRQRVTNFEKSSGHIDGGTAWFHIDAKGRVWRGGDSGYYVSDGVHTDLDDWARLGTEARFPYRDSMQNAVFEDHDGSMWFGSSTTVMHYYPPDDLFTRLKKPTPVAVTTVRWDRNNELLSETAPGYVDAAGHSLNVKFAALSYKNPKALQYRYRLYPIEKEFKATQKHEVYYDSLPAGSYRFEVIAKAINNAWTATPATYSFHVAGTWYSSTWFLGGTPLGGVGMGIWWWGRRRKEQRRKQAELDRFNRVKDLFQQAMAMGESERSQWMEGQKQQDPVLAEEVERMLAQTASPFDKPLWQQPPEDAGTAIGTLLGERYRIEKFLAAGGFARVYLAKDEKLGGRLTAIKIPLRQSETGEWLEKRLRQEIEALGRIRHPNVVAVLDTGTTEDNRRYLAMDYVEGETLRAALGNGALPMERCARLIRQMGQAIAAAHAQHVIHRDLKPENMILRNPATADELLVVIDFGIAVIKGPADPTTGMSRPAGSLDYMAPELLAGSASAASDLYSMALIIFELFTGQRAATLRGEGPLSGRVSARLAEARPELPEPVANLIRKALDYQPDARPKGAREFCEAVADGVSGQGRRAPQV